MVNSGTDALETDDDRMLYIFRKTGAVVLLLYTATVFSVPALALMFTAAGVPEIAETVSKVGTVAAAHGSANWSVAIVTGSENVILLEPSIAEPNVFVGIDMFTSHEDAVWNAWNVTMADEKLATWKLVTAI